VNTNPTTPHGARMCPPWCSHCITDNAGVTHTSAPTTVQVGDEQLTLRLTHTVHFDDPEPRSVEVHIDGESQGFVLPTTQHEWPVNDLPGLIAALTDVYFRLTPMLVVAS